MSFSSASRTSVRRASVVALAAAGLAVGGAAAASATTTTQNITGTTVSVTFTVEPGQVGDVCVAALTPTAHAPALAANLTGLKLDAVLADKEVTLLKNGSLPTATPSIIAPSTVTAANVPANVYSLVTSCASSKAPSIQTVTVGDPIQAASGSLQSMLAGDNLGNLSVTLTNLQGMGLVG